MVDIWKKIKSIFSSAIEAIFPHWGDFMNSQRSKKSLDLIEKQVLRKEEIDRKQKYSDLIKSIIVEKFIKEGNIDYHLNDSFDENLIEIFIYSYGYETEMGKLGFELTEEEEIPFNREYPILLEKMGFVRLGGSTGNSFLIKKEILIREFKNKKRLKEFLLNEFKKTRNKELKNIKKYLTDKEVFNEQLFKELRKKLLPYHFLIKELKVDNESFGKLNNNLYVFTRSNQNTKLLNILKNSVDYKKVLEKYKKTNKKSPKELIEKNLTLELIIKKCDKISTTSKRSLNRKYKKLTINKFLSLEEELNDYQVIVDEINLYRESLREFNIII